jgi:ABC-2 type transport system permease protein
VLEKSIMNNIVEKIFKLGVIGVALIGICIFFAFSETFTLPIHFEFLPWAILSLLFSLIMMNLIDVSMGLAGFWMDDIDFLTGAFFTADALLSGKVIPVTFLPTYLQQVGFFLPFRYTVSFPIEMMLGRLSAMEIISGFSILFSWTIFFWYLQKILYKKGVIRYSSFGG